MRRLLLVSVALVALVASSCGDDAGDEGAGDEGADAAVTTVTSATGDPAVTQSVVADEAETSSDFLATLPESDEVLSVNGDTVASAFVVENAPNWALLQQLPDDQAVAGLLTLLAQVRIAEQLAADRSDDDHAAGREAGEQALEGFIATAPGEVNDALVDEIRRLFVARETLIASLVPDAGDPEDAYEEFRATTLCSSHVLVETAAEADAVYARLSGGEDVAVVAAEASTDPSAATNGGDLGCVAIGRFVPPYEEAVLAADPGGLLEPVESEFGFHVIVAHDDAKIREYFDANADGFRLDQASAAAEAEVGAAILVAEVVVDPAYGTWESNGGFVVPVSSP